VSNPVSLYSRHCCGDISGNTYTLFASPPLTLCIVPMVIRGVLPKFALFFNAMLNGKSKRLRPSLVKFCMNHLNFSSKVPIPNIIATLELNISVGSLDAFATVDDILRQGVQGISDLIAVNGLVNLDFADVEAIMRNAGSALMGIGMGNGDNRAVDAVKQAIDSPLLEVSIQGAKGVMINFTGGLTC